MFYGVVRQAQGAVQSAHSAPIKSFFLRVLFSADNLVMPRDS